MRLSVVAGREKEVVGVIEAKSGLVTNKGKIVRLTEKTIFLEDGSQVRNPNGLTVRHSIAVRNGYPHAEGCERFRVIHARRNNRTVAA